MAECLGGCGFFAPAGGDGYCSVCARRKKPRSEASPTARSLPPDPVGLPVDIAMEDECDSWSAACLGAALDDAQAVQVYLAKGEPPNRRMTTEECQALGNSGVWVDVGSTLLDIALERDSTNVVMLLTEGGSKEEDHHELFLRRRLSSLEEVLQRSISTASAVAGGEFGGEPPTLPQRVRLALAQLRAVRADGLCYLDLPYAPAAPGLSLPVEVAEAAPELRNRAMGLLIEAHDCLQALEVAVGWWRGHGCALVLPLYTSADLNCLLHACCLTLAGVRDTQPAVGADKRCLLRDVLHESLACCPPLRAAAADPTRRTPVPGAAGPPAAAAPAEEAEQFIAEHELHDRQAAVLRGEDQLLERQAPVAAAALRRMEEVVALAREDKTALDGAHIFALAQVLRRPLICYAPEEHEGGEARHILTVPFRVSGIYLPLLWEPADCSPDPLLLAYTRGHFTGLCPVAPSTAVGDNQVVVPLYDAEGAPLPVPFAPSAPGVGAAAVAADGPPPAAAALGGATSPGGDGSWAGWAGTPPAAASGGVAASRDCSDLVGRYLRLTALAKGHGAILRCGPSPEVARTDPAVAAEMDRLPPPKRRFAEVLAKYRAVVGSSVQRRLQAEGDPTMDL